MEVEFDLDGPARAEASAARMYGKTWATVVDGRGNVLHFTAHDAGRVRDALAGLLSAVDNLDYSPASGRRG